MGRAREYGAVIFAGAVLRARVTIGKDVVVGIGVVVTRDVPPEAVVFVNLKRVQCNISEY